jgi:predicted nucleotidyltransferase
MLHKIGLVTFFVNKYRKRVSLQRFPIISILAEIFKVMIDNRLMLIDLKHRLEDHFSDSLKSVVLFGSQANNTSTEFSDYDILILLNQDYNRNDENIILDICYDVNLKYNIIIDAHLLSFKELESKRGRQPIFINALKNGIYA